MDLTEVKKIKKMWRVASCAWRKEHSPKKPISCSSILSEWFLAREFVFSPLSATRYEVQEVLCQNTG